MHKFIVFLVSFAILIVFTACDNSFRVKNISLYPESISMAPLDTVRVSATIDYQGGDFNNPNLIQLKWSSSNPNVATVDNTGSVAAVANGNAEISVECGSAVAVCSVTVSAKSAHS